jgi:hypothetical protein
VAISKAAAALARLSTERRDDYEGEGWINVGMALKGLGAIGYELWRAWSASSPKYNVGDCERKWPTFRVGVPGSTDITLASLYWYADVDAGEPVSTLDDAERRQLDAYKARDVQQQRILAMKAPLAAKAVWLGMLPELEATQTLQQSGSLAVNYSNFAEKMNTSKTSVGNAVELGERAELWRKDAEHKEVNGYDVLAMRLDLQPAFYRPELAEAIPETRGGKRAGAGRKPKCATCPPGTPMRETTETTIKTFCHGCGECLDEVTTYKTRELMPDDAPADAEFKNDTGYVTPAGYEPEREPVDAPAANVATNVATNGSSEFKTVTGKHHAPAAGTTTVSCLKKTRAELVPVALAETFDITAAIRLADTYAPADATECRHYKTSLVWTQRGEHEKAAALAANVHDERARAILLHLANRAPSLAPA